MCVCVMCRQHCFIGSVLGPVSVAHDTHTHAHTGTQAHAHTHTHTHRRTHTHTHTRTRTLRMHGMTLTMPCRDTNMFFQRISFDYADIVIGPGNTPILERAVSELATRFDMKVS